MTRRRISCALALVAILVVPRVVAADDRVTFEANHGQFDARVRFASRGHGYTLFLTDDDAVIVLRGLAAGNGGATTSTIRLALDGAESRRAVGRTRQPGVVNYLRGRDPLSWRTGIDTYERVVYDAVYPGVDLIYYAAGSHHEYDLVVAPGADPSRIAMRITGADRRLDATGDLRLITDAGTLTMRAPRVYQDIDGTRRPVEARYSMGASGTIGFAIAAYDRSAPLVIDPEMLYSTYVGGSGNGFDAAAGVAVDAAGAAYVVGTTEAVDFPTVNAIDGTRGGLQDAFVMKLAPDGTRLYATYLGGSSYDDGVGITARADGVAYVVGNTSSTDFPVPGAYQPLYGGNNDVFVVELSAAGSAITRGTYLGGSGVDGPRGVQLTQYDGVAPPEARFGDSIVVFGSTTSANFPLLSPSQVSRVGDRDAFVTILDRATFLPRYSSYAGSPGTNYAEALAVNRATGRMYLLVRRPGDVGALFARFFPRVSADGAPRDGTDPLEIDIAIGLLQTAANQEMRTYGIGATCLTPSGPGTSLFDERGLTGILCSQRVGSLDRPRTALDGPLATAVMALLTPGCVPVAPASTCTERAALILVNDSGESVAAVNFGGTRAGREFTPTRAVIGTGGRVHVIGTTADPALPLVNPVQSTNNGSGEGFVLTFDPLAGTTSFLSYLGGSGFDTLADIAVDATGNRWVVGSTQSTNFPVTPATAAQPMLNGRVDGFVTRISADPPGPAAPTNLVAQANGLTVALSWTAAPGALSYQLEAGSSALAANLAVFTVGNVTSLLAPAPAGRYFVRVRAVTAAGLSGPSNEVTFVLAPPGACTSPPPAPGGHTAQVAGLNVALSWGGAAGATSYVLEAGSASGLANLFNANVGAATALASAAPAGRYFTRVRAVNACGTSGPSNEVSFTLGCIGPPPAPASLAFSKAGSLVALTWSAAQDAVSYRLRVGTATGLTNLLDADLGAATGLQANAAGLPPGQYFARVVAVNACGVSGPSNEVVIPVP